MDIFFKIFKVTKMSTPKRIIREIARDSTASRVRKTEKREVERSSKRQRGGGGAMTYSEHDDTPRGNIRILAHATTDSRESGRRNRKQDFSASSSATPKDARKAIQRYVREVATDSLEKPSPAQDQLDIDEYGSEYESTVEDEFDEEGKPIQENLGPLQVIARQKGQPKKFGTMISRRLEARKTGEIPYTKVTSVFKSFLGEMPRPNRPTAMALEEAHASLTAYLDRSVKDYARLARMDDVAPSNLTRSRVEQLLREQGLLVKPLGDEIRRLLDREDADTALGLPISRARASRI